MNTIIRDHECSAWCRDARHCELAYVSVDPPGDPDLPARLLQQEYARHGARVLAVERAREAPPVTAFPPERLLQLAGTRRGEDSYLVWFVEAGHGD